MGFSGIGAFIMLFFAIIIVASMLMIIQTGMIETASLVYSQKDTVQKELQTRVSILNITFDNSTNPDTTTAYIQNTGQTKLDPEYIDIFIDEIKVPRDDANRTIAFEPGSTTLNPIHWDPDEVIKTEVYMDLANITHIFTITAEYNGKDTTGYLG